MLVQGVLSARSIVSDFDAAFRSVAIPRLAARCRIEAIRVADREQGFAAAVDAVTDAARRMGMAYLSNDHITDLLDWIAATVLRDIDAAEAITRQVREAERRDPVAHYSALAAEAPHLQWTFAAISPEYRRHLLRERHGGR